jgi:hypothetical protein
MSFGIEPTPDLWFTSERQHKLRKTFANCTELLICSGQLKASLHYWLRNEIAIEASLDPEMWPNNDFKLELNNEFEKYSNSSVSSQLASLSEDSIKQKLMVRSGGMRWAHFQWKNRLQEMFLQNKRSLDKASCCLIRLKDKNLAQEIYHRILADEDSMSSLALKFGQSPENIRGGLISLSPLSELPLGLDKLLPRLKIGEVTAPMRLGDSFALVKLLEMQPSIFDDETEKILLKLELNRWLGMMVSYTTERLLQNKTL